MAAASVSLGAHEPARHVIAHLSDTHLVGRNLPLGGRYDTADGLRRALDALGRMRIRPDALVFTGDLTDQGEPDAYAALRETVEPFAADLGTPVVWVAGNHDERPALRAELLGSVAGVAAADPITGVWDLDGLRLVALDTSVPGWHHGDLDEGQLDWLARLLAEPAPHGTLLAMHHPPLPSHVPLFDILELRHQDRLAEVIAGTDVRGILAGHLHYATAGTFAGVPVSVAAATCYTMNVSRPAAQVNGMGTAQSFQLVHVYDDTITHTVVPVEESETADFFDQAWLERMAALTPAERWEEFSRKPTR